MAKSEILLYLLLLLCVLTLPAFSGDRAVPAPEVESTEAMPQPVAAATTIKVGSCGAEFGCDVTALGTADSELFDHDALLEELAASLSAE